MCPFDYMIVVGSGLVGSVNQVNNNCWVSVVTQNDRPKSVRNRCVIEVFGGITLLIGVFCRCKGCVYRTDCDVFLFSC